jgi:glycosyltransferase involved in cell wall biosynthesis
MKISVLTPSYNSGSYLSRAIDSVLVQDYQDYEHIVVDGGSNDNSIEILSKYDHLIWVSEKDKGQSDAMNKAFNMATGDIIVYLNADDYFSKGAFRRVVDEFARKADVDIIVGNLIHQYESTESTISIPSIKFRELILPFKYNFPFNPVSYFYRRKVQISVGDFPVDNHFVMDYWFILRAFKYFNVKKINIELGVFYHTGTNKTSQNTNFSINKYAFTQAGIFGLKWQIYFIICFIPKVFVNISRVVFSLLKYFLLIVLLRKHISFEEFESLGFKKIMELKG